MDDSAVFMTDKTLNEMSLPLLISGSSHLRDLHLAKNPEYEIDTILIRSIFFIDTTTGELV